MAKPQEQGIQTMLQLFDAGYRYALPVNITSLSQLSTLRAGLGPLEKIIGRNITLQDAFYFGSFTRNSMFAEQNLQ